MFLLGFRTYPQQARMQKLLRHPSAARHDSKRPVQFLERRCLTT
jgi:hypothetical protein